MPLIAGTRLGSYEVLAPISTHFSRLSMSVRGKL